LYSKHDPSKSTGCSTRATIHTNFTKNSGVAALHFDFVAKPDGTRALNCDLRDVLDASGLADEGLKTALLLVSDREARLVTLVTFWNAQRFATARERSIAWMQKLLTPFADGPVRAQTSTPQLVWARASAECDLDKALSDRVAELAPMAG